MKPTLKAPGTQSLKQKYDELLSRFAFKFNLRRYTKLDSQYVVKYFESFIDKSQLCIVMEFAPKVRRYRSNLSNAS
jgi:hypothetical protein